MTRLEDEVYNFGLILLESIVGRSVAAKKEATLRDELVCAGTLLSTQKYLCIGRGKAMHLVISITFI